MRYSLFRFKNRNGKPFLLFLFILFLIPTFLKGATIYLNDGRKIRGKIVNENDYEIVVKTKYGILKIDRGEIKKIDRTKSPQELYEERLKKCKTAKDYYELGLWAKSQNMLGLALDNFQKALELDPNFEPAHKALGHVFHKGRWWTKEEYNEKVLGLVYRNGKWIPKKEAEELDRKLIQERAARVKKLWKKRREELKGRSWPEALQDPIETEHYIIYCNSSPEVGKMYADFMEQLFDRFDRIFRYYRPVYSELLRKRKCIIMIHKNYEEFLNMHALPPGVGGFYRPKALGSMPGRTVVAFHGSFGDTGNTYGVLAHEGTHQFEHLVMPDIMNRPTWLIEGLAVFFGDGHKLTSSGKLKVGVIPRDRLATLQEAIRKNKYIRLKDLLRTPHARFSGFHYSHGWGLIYYMLDMNKRIKDKKRRKKMRKIFQEFFDLNCKKEFAKNPIQNTRLMAKHFESMIKKELGQSIEEFEKDWKEYIMNLELPLVGKITGGNRFVSEKMGFEIAKPLKYSWKFVTEDLKPGEKVVILNKKTSGRIGLVARRNMFLMDSLELARNIRLRLNQSFQNLQFIEGKKVYLKGYEGYRFRFRGLPKATINTGHVRKTEQYYDMYIVATLDNYYILKFQCDSDKVQQNQKIFQWILDRFRILK